MLQGILTVRLRSALLQIEFARDDEVRRLVEPGDLLHSLRLSVADRGLGEDVFNRRFQNVADELRNGITLTSERHQTAKSLSSETRSFGSARERSMPLRNVCPSP